MSNLLGGWKENGKRINLNKFTVSLEGWMELENCQKNKWIVQALEEIHKGNTSDELKNFIKEVIEYFEK